ncbi:ureidoglycolate hydrolase [Xylaria bambusicola]|uniref:ureidoglycolate hydrolase n=1 Tax=Xylaria bambusicola TaxID=326684 RepID=UPI0020077EC5|nr:ureidoglycolate hydrolase [Xylaria bambusicola]KAI0514545.1 ureidoglycolate hydrolase [Xylaria bambusicola]
MLVRTIPITEPLAITAEPLTRAGFAPFGDVVANPWPESTPLNTPPAAIARGDLPCGAVSANQGTAIQYRAIASMRDLYGEAPSRKAASPRMTMFVCGARTLVSRDNGGGGEDQENGFFEVKVLERHPFTSQTFIPLTADTSKRYLVIVAPTLERREDDGDGKLLPAPEGTGLPGRGLPDVRGLRAFVASGEQAVTYAAGTWHAPMVALGPAGSTIDFVVVQFANDIPVEDCQEVALENGRRGVGDGDGDGQGEIWVRVPVKDTRALARL